MATPTGSTSHYNLAATTTTQTRSICCICLENGEKNETENVRRVVETHSGHCLHVGRLKKSSSAQELHTNNGNGHPLQIDQNQSVAGKDNNTTKKTAEVSVEIFEVEHIYDEEREIWHIRETRCSDGALVREYWHMPGFEYSRPRLSGGCSGRTSRRNSHDSSFKQEGP